MRAAKTLVDLRICDDSSVFWLLADAIRIKIPCAGQNYCESAHTFIHVYGHGGKFKITKILNFIDSNLKSCSMHIKHVTILIFLVNCH